MSKAVVQFRTKDFHHRNPEYCDRKYPGYARHGVVDSRSRADSVLIYRIHNDGGERSYSDRRPKTQNNHRWEERLPVALSNGRHREQSKSKRDNEWTSDQRNSRTIAGDKSTGPPREKEHEQNQRKDSGTSGCGGIALDLDQVQWEQEKENSNCGVQEERKQVCATEATGFEQRQREHR